MDDLMPNSVTHYTPEQEAARRALIAIIQAEQQEYQKRVQPYLDRLGQIEAQARKTYFIDRDLAHS